jgi:hypothetical protein
VLLALSGAVVTAQSAPRHFRYERPIVTSGAGSYRLAVDAELLAGGAPFAVVPRPAPAPGEPEWAATGGLADLRLFDATNREVPYLLVRPPAARTWMHGALLAIASTRTQTRRTSGFEADLGAAVIVDRIRVTGLPSPFLKRLSLEASGDREHWTLVAAEATLFDLPDQDLRQLELPFAAGAYRYLRVTWDDTSSGQMSAPREVSARRVDATATRPPTASLVAERRPSEPGRSRYVIRLPGPHMPVAALRLDVGPGHVLRPAEVTESRLTGVEAAPAVLGRATLRQVLVGAVTASNLRIPITPPAEAQLDLVIDDGDNSPLPAVGVVAEFAELPWIYFESDGSPLVARYGSAGAEPPRYDLEAVRETLRIDSAREAQWASAKALPPPADAAPAPLPVTGAAIDAALFRHRRDVPAGNAGLVALPLDEAILAESAGPARGFADLRVIDGRGRQVPYLLERRDEPLSLDLALTPTTSAAVDRSVAASGSHTKSRGPLTTYRITLPYHSLPSAKLVLGTDARVFDRWVFVGVERGPDHRVREDWVEELASSRWIHADRERPTPPLVLPLRSIAASAILVVVDEGDNGPLPLAPPRLLLPSYRIRFYRNAGDALSVAYGRDDLAPPRYDLALLAPQVLGVSATDVAAGADSAKAVAGVAGALASPWVFWGVLSLAVVVLLGFVARLIGKT